MAAIILLAKLVFWGALGGYVAYGLLFGLAAAFPWSSRDRSHSASGAAHRQGEG